MAKRKPHRRDYRHGAPHAGPGAAAAPSRGSPQGHQGLWIHGIHPVLAALANEARQCWRLLATEEAARHLEGQLGPLLARRGLALETASREELDRLFPEAVHQGLALSVAPLEEATLDDLLREQTGAETSLVVVLDQVTDPHNAGAILRSAVAFGAVAVIATERHAPSATATLAKAASGALEAIPLIRVTNLARTLEELKEGGYWCIGLDAAAPSALTEIKLAERIALVLGAEGQGLRRLTREHCDFLVRIPMAPSAISSLNVSNAAAVALYEIFRSRT